MGDDPCDGDPPEVVILSPSCWSASSGRAGQATVDVGSSVDLTLTLLRELGPSLDPDAAEAFATTSNFGGSLG